MSTSEEYVSYAKDISYVAGAQIAVSLLLLIKGLSKGELAFFTNFVKDNVKKIGMTKG